AAPRPSDRLTPLSAIAGPARDDPEVSCMFRCFVLNPEPGSAPPRSYGGWRRLVQRFVMVAWALAAAIVQPAAAADRPVRSVALGDSLTGGLGLPVNAAFPVKLEKALQAKGLTVEVTNAGVSGDTASGGLARLDWSVPDGTEAVIVELGANDMLNGVDPK